MNHLEAKLILQAYRPGGEDASDPFFREALEQVERDPELKRWFANEMACETNLRRRLETAVPVPPNLKANLLALKKLERPVPFWLGWIKLTAATAAVILAAITGFMLLPPRGGSMDSFQQTMTLCSLQHRDHVTYEPRDLARIQEWLQGHGVTTNFDLPSALQAVGAQGCRVIDWHKQAVTMICFVSKEKDVHVDLFIMDDPQGVILRTDETPRFATKNGLTTACWLKNNKFYLLAGENGEAVRNLAPSI